MTNERARSELEQLYMSLSEEKKKALDVAFKAMEQADNIPVMYYPQVDGITPTVVAQADGEKTCGTCRNEDTYHCAECENKSDYEQSQADGEYISRKAVLSILADHFDNPFDMVRDLPSVAIPPEHDGCKDCKYETYPEYYYPCCECKQNYKDEWQKKPHWIMKHRTINEVKYHTGLDDMGEEHTIKELIRYEVDEPYCSECGMKAGDTSQNYCCFCGTKMGGEQHG